MNRVTRQVSIAAFCLLLAACGSSSDGGTSTVTVAANLTDIQNKIFTQSCAVAGCHNSVSRAGNLDLSNETISNASLIGTPATGPTGLNTPTLVDPGSPATSYLIQKLEGSAGITGSRMPLTGSKLSQQNVDVIKDWITSLQ